MSLANYLTFSRIFISPIFLIVYMKHDTLGINSALLPYILIFLLGLSELSDALDGMVARRYNQVTDFGKILDPMADSLSRISVFLTFTLDPVGLPMLLIFVFLYRDSVTSTLRTICALKGFALAARTSGKIKAIVQAVAAFAILFLLIPHSLGYLSTETLQSYATTIVSIAAAYSVASAFEYIYSNRTYISQALIPVSR